MSNFLNHHQALFQRTIYAQSTSGDRIRLCEALRLRRQEGDSFLGSIVSPADNCCRSASVTQRRDVPSVSSLVEVFKSGTCNVPVGFVLNLNVTVMSTFGAIDSYGSCSILLVTYDIPEYGCILLTFCDSPTIGRKTRSLIRSYHKYYGFHLHIANSDCAKRSTPSVINSCEQLVDGRSQGRNGTFSSWSYRSNQSNYVSNTSNRW